MGSSKRPSSSMRKIASGWPHLLPCLPQVPLDYTPSPPPSAASPAEDSKHGEGGIPVHVHTTAGSEYLTITAEVPGTAARGTADAAIPAAAAGPAAATAAGTAAALAAALARLAAAMSAAGLSWHSALFVHLYVPSMAHFGAANEAYARFFPPINPPSRATVELAPNAELALVVEVLFAR